MNTVEQTSSILDADTVVAGIVERKKKEQLGDSVDKFGQSVEEEAQETAERLQAQFGNAVQGIAGEIMQRAKSYHQSRNEILDSQGKVDDAAKIGAAAYVNKAQGNTVTYDQAAMDYELEDPGYWERTREHERIHQEEQAPQFNRESIGFLGKDGQWKEVEVGSTLVEWHPSSEANETEDLTPDYQQHVEDGEELAGALGSGGRNRIKEALKDSDMQALQSEVLQRQQKQIIQKLLNRELRPEDLN